MALVTMLILYHQPGAPTGVWLNVLVASALLTELPTSKFKHWVKRYYFLSMAVLLIIALPFMAQQAQQALYPQLEYSNYKVSPALAEKKREQQKLNQSIEYKDMSVSSFNEKEMAMEELIESNDLMNTLSMPMKIAPKSALAGYDFNTKVQTGPGLPSWTWRRSELNFSGPVAKDHIINLWLLSPTENRLLAFSRIALLLALFACVLGFSWSKGLNLKSIFPMLTTILVIASVTPQTVMADIAVPEDAILQQLKQRLLAAPSCAPSCAASSAMQLKIATDQLVIIQTLDTAQRVLVPLPGQRGNWTPQQVLVDGIESNALSHDQQGTLWVMLSPGKHQLLISGVFQYKLKCN